MLRGIISSAAVALAIATSPAKPAYAQAVITEPGYCAFFYPYANCQNKGPGNPYTDPNFRRNLSADTPAWSSGQTMGMAPKRTHRQRPE